MPVNVDIIWITYIKFLSPKINVNFAQQVTPSHLLSKANSYSSNYETRNTNRFDYQCIFYIY